MGSAPTLTKSDTGDFSIRLLTTKMVMTSLWPLPKLVEPKCPNGGRKG